MRPWAEWTAKTALVAVGFAAVGGGLSGVALAGPGGSVTSGSSSVLSGNKVIASVSIPADVCGNAGALLGIASAGCRGGSIALTKLPAAVGSAVAGAPAAGTAVPGVTGGNGNVSAGSGNGVTVGVSIPVDVCGSAAAVLGGSTAGCAGGAATGNTDNRPAGTVIQHAVVPVTAAVGSVGALAGLPPVPGLTDGTTNTGPLARTLGSAGAGGPAAGAGSGNTFIYSPIYSPSAGSGLGGTNVPTAAQLVGLGTLPGLADLPSLAGLANLPALNGETGGGVPLPGTALSAANAAGMSSNSFAALAVGALLAGASALKIAGRRVRDRKAGIGVAI
jgi:ChpA-C